MDVHDEIAEAEKGNFEAKLRAMNVVINFAPGFLQIFQKLQSTYYVSRDAELFESQVRRAHVVHRALLGLSPNVLFSLPTEDLATFRVCARVRAMHLPAGARRPTCGLCPRR